MNCHLVFCMVCGFKGDVEEVGDFDVGEDCDVKTMWLKELDNVFWGSVSIATGLAFHDCQAAMMVKIEVISCRRKRHKSSQMSAPSWARIVTSKWLQTSRLTQAPPPLRVIEMGPACVYEWFKLSGGDSGVLLVPSGKWNKIQQHSRKTRHIQKNWTYCQKISLHHGTRPKRKLSSKHQV